MLDLYRPFITSFRNLAEYEANRFSEYLFRATLSYHPDKTLIDLGGGTNAINPLLQLMGMKVSVVDDLGDSGYDNFDVSGLLDAVHRQVGVDVYQVDIFRSLPFHSGSIDVVTTYDCLEHWYGSAKHVMDEITRVTRSSGFLVIGVPNAANLRKRIACLPGKNIWSRFDEWYYDQPFRGHVREPIADDLRNILKINGYELLGVFGRNWQVAHRQKLSSVIAVFEPLLSLRPSLCSDIYVVGRRR